MKRSIAFFALMFVQLAAHAQMQTFGDARSKGGDFGLGLLLGDPVGISAKFFLTPSTAFDLGVGYGYSDGDSDGFQVHADYLIHPHVFERNEDFSVSWFTGAGGALILSDDPNINVRVPLGVNFTFMEVPIETFIEFAPGLELVDDFGFAFDGGIGARYYF